MLALIDAQKNFIQALQFNAVLSLTVHLGTQLVCGVRFMGTSLSMGDSFSFDGSEINAAGAAALRKVSVLSDQAPKGRFFASIATLNELSIQTVEALEKGDLKRASHVAAELSRKSEFRIPSLFKKKG